mmetsp:Transcript_45176/g.115586  ORF Transcript_45176/g.115586 Transcript_45176/m.115586 type:complete len:387 (+) Transcript_45176:256-1416(+)
MISPSCLLLRSNTRGHALLLLASSGFGLRHAFPEGGGHLVGLGEDERGVAEHVTGGRLQLPGGQSDAALFAVLAQDHHLQAIAGGEDVLHGIDALVADLADVQQAVGLTQVDEGAERPDRLHDTLHNIANLEVHGGDLGDGLAVGEHQTLALLVNLQELERDLHAHGVLGVHAVAELAGGDKALDVLHIDQQAAPVQAQHLAHHGHILLLELTHALPSHRVLKLPQGQANLAILGVVLGNEELALGLHGQHLVGLDVRVHGALVGRDIARALGTNVNVRATGIDTEDGAGDEVPTLEAVIVLLQHLSKLRVHTGGVHVVIHAAGHGGVLRQGGGEHRQAAHRARSLGGGRHGRRGGAAYHRWAGGAGLDLRPSANAAHGDGSHRSD